METHLAFYSNLSDSFSSNITSRLGTSAIRLYDEDLKLLNKSDTPERPLHRIPEEYGGEYIAMLEVSHLLHCLDSLRKSSHKE
jgi:hypothetical protein